MLNPAAQTIRWPRRLLGVMVAATLASVGCNTASTTETPVEVLVQIRGTVTNADSGLPIQGAALEVVATSTTQQFATDTTDAAGAYELSYLYRYFPSDPAASFCPFLGFVEAAGFVPETFQPQCSGFVETLDLELLVE